MNRIDHIVYTNKCVKNTSKLKDFVSFIEIILGSRIQEALGIPLSSKEHFFFLNIEAVFGRSQITARYRI